MTKFKTVTNIYTGEQTDSNIVNAKEIEIINREVTKDDVVLDIGANVGYFTVLLASLAKHVYAFEPDPDNFKELRENTKYNDNITNYQLAASDTVSLDTLYKCPTDNGMHRLYDSKWCKGGTKLPVETMCIDILLYSTVKKIKFVKIDVEGYEFKVFKGMIQILERDHPTIMMECHLPSIEEAGDNPKDLYEFLKNDLGYDDPINCFTNGTIVSYDKLEENTRHCPAVNLLWKYSSI